MTARKTEKKKPGPKPGSDKVPNSGGSRKGIPNKATSKAREAIAQFVEGNIDKLQNWIDAIAETDGPKEAFTCLMKVLEYHVPKLQRSEVTGPNGEDLGMEIRITFEAPKK
jgi:hypothetical protein